MSRVCSVCQKGPMAGNNQSHSHRLSRRVWKVNVQKVKYTMDGKNFNDYVCTRCLRSGKIQRI